ncbi:head maturation protease, ClpP-related [Methylobacterium sp. GC_Met_2]|uniref:head maturation protease, ClpP-related n=1 Tax=Methylobacterium sp. GC_Met_2 TaxID=2937376 RepID=UPI00226B66F2|nr:head maturation protease, ClpP-related [Methylobacterium sp. GC_Met_2]
MSDTPTKLICDGALILYGDVGEAGWSGIDGFTAADVVSALAQLGSGTDVVVRINSCGGNAFEGAAIHAILSAHRGKITTVVEGVGASAASIIAMAGDERIIAPGSLMMVHDPAGLTIGTAEDHDDTAGMLRTLAGSMASIYAAATGRPVAEHLADMSAETWLTAEDALAGRYATKIGTAPIAATACAPFPFRAYAKAPRELVALADAKGWSRRAFTASHAAGRRASPTGATAMPNPARPAPTLSPSEAVMKAYCDARTAAVTPRADSGGLALASMRRQLEARGIKPAA